MPNRKALKAKRDGWRKAGLCAACGGDRDRKPLLTCSACLAASSVYTARWRAERSPLLAERRRARSAAGRCRCGRSTVAGYGSCPRCRLKMGHRPLPVCVDCNVLVDKWARRCPPCKAAWDRQGRQKRRAKFLAAGLCTACGQTPMSGTRICPGCLKLARERYHRWQGSSTTRPRAPMAWDHRDEGATLTDVNKALGGAVGHPRSHKDRKKD